MQKLQKSFVISETFLYFCSEHNDVFGMYEFEIILR